MRHPRTLAVTGTETIRRVAAKLPGYAGLATATGITTPVLFWFPTRKREAAARAAFGATPVPVATAASRDGSAQPAGPAWLPIGHDGPRLRLAEIGLLYGQPATTARETPRPGTRPGPAGGSSRTPPVPPAPPRGSGNTQE